MKEDELKEIFLAEALEGFEELNKLFTELEKDHHHKKAIDAVFRITHTMKANAAGMGYTEIAELAHTLEDIFSEIRTGKIIIESKLFNDLFRSVDILGALLNRIKDPATPPVKYKGIKTKLEVILRVAKYGADALPEEKSQFKQNLPDTNNEINEQEDGVHESYGQQLNGNGLYKDHQTENNFYMEEDSVEVAEKDSDHELESKVTFSDLVQIPVRKLDNLMNLVGELIIERDRVMTVAGNNSIGNRNNEFSRLQRITSELQYSVMDVRLVQVNVLFNKFHRIVRDTASVENKKVNLFLEGTENEIDRNVLQIISDSLVHIVRNAISHGIEKPEDRIKAGKPEAGRVTIRAKSEKDAVIIEVEDDGKGMDAKIIKRKAIEKGLLNMQMSRLMSEDDIINLIFEPGFSSAEKITAVSGRGVGMDVVKRSIDSIGGKVKISTEVGKGSVFSLSLPSSMALKGALLFELGESEYAIPLTYTDAVIQLSKKEIHKVANGLVASHLSKNISILFLKDLFNIETIDDFNKSGVFHQTFNGLSDNDKLFLVVVSYGNRDVGFVVDKLLQQKEIVEKPLAKPLDDVRFFSGATILGTGKVCLVLDIPAIIHQLFKLTRK